MSGVPRIARSSSTDRPSTLCSVANHDSVRCRGLDSWAYHPPNIRLGCRPQSDQSVRSWTQRLHTIEVRGRSPHICDGRLRVHGTCGVNGGTSGDSCHGVGERRLWTGRFSKSRKVLVRCTRSQVRASQIRSVELVLHSRQQVQVPQIQSLTLV